MDPSTMTSTQGARKAAGSFAYHVIGRNPKTWGFIILGLIAVLTIFIITTVVYVRKYNAAVASDGFVNHTASSNFYTGGNNPQWHHQMGDAGWGGSMHSTYQKGEPRVWGASADGGHDMSVTTESRKQCGAPWSHAALGEVDSLIGVQALDPLSVSAKKMSDDALIKIMNGGEA